MVGAVFPEAAGDPAFSFLLVYLESLTFATPPPDRSQKWGLLGF